MSSECSEGSLPRACAERFEALSRAMARLDDVAEDVAVLRKAVVGNGDAER